MVQFARYDDPTRDPKYDFREPDGPKASSFWGDVFKGAGNLLDTGVKAMDTARKISLDEDTSDIVNSARTQNIAEYKELTGNILAVTQKGAQSATGGSTGGQSPNSPTPTDEYGNVVGGLPNANTPPPGPIASELRYIDKMNEGMKQGHFDSERFFGEVQQRTANLISRYPGYSDYIQAKVTHYLGTDPANAQREHLQQTIQQLLGGTNHTQTQIDKWNSEVMTHYAPVMGPEWTRSALTAGLDLAAQQQYRVQATDRLHFDYGQKKAKEGFELRRMEQTATQDDAIADATSYFDGQHAKMLATANMAAAGWTGTMNDVHNNLATQRLNGGPDIEQNKAMALAIGGLRAGWEVNFETEWTRPRFDKDPKTGQFTQSYSTLIRDQAAKEQFIKKYRTIFDSLERQVGAGQFDLATVVSDLSARKLDGAIAGLYSEKAVLALAAGSKAFGQAFDSIYGASNIRSNMDLNSKISQTFLKAALGQTMATGTAGGNTLEEAARQHRAALAADPRYAGQKLPPAFLNGLMTNLTTIITTPAKEVPVEVRYNAVEVLTHPTTPQFIINNITPEQQFKAYGVLYSPEVSDHIKEFKATEIWDRYKTSAGQTFNTIFGVFANDVLKAIKQDYKGKFEWNEKTQQIDYTPEKIGLATDLNRNPVSSAVARLNEGLRVYADILKRDGEVIIPKVLEGLGLNMTAPTENINLEKMLKTLRTIPVQGTAQGKTETTATEAAAVSPIERWKMPGITPKPQAPTSPLKEDKGNGGGSIKDMYGLSASDIDRHMSRPMFINGTPVVDLKEKKDILNKIIRDKEGKYYYNKGGQWIPVKL